MSSKAAAAIDHEKEPPPKLGGIFALIVLVEILTIAGLYWFGRHFS